MSSTTEQALEREPGELDETIVRDAMETALQEDGRKLAQIAPETGIPYGTLSTWRVGKYAGDNKRIAVAVQAWLTAREARSRTHATLPAAPSFVMTKTASRIWEILEHAQMLPDISVIAGGAGIGKTVAAEAYQARAPNVWMLTCEPCLATTRAILDLLVLKLDIHPDYRPAHLSAAIQKRLRGSQGVVVLDEAQHLSPRTMDQMRTIHDLAKIGIVFMGNDTVFTQFGADKRTPQFAQLFSRIGQRFTRQRPLKSDVETLMTAWGLTRADTRELVLGIGLQPGGMRGMTKMLRMAFGLAASGGATEPTIAHVGLAWEQLGGTVRRAA